ncbi:hypothetical protein BLD25_00920 [Candidatus Gracilibacteria bacterium GN02-872]|nr:hypothetical protein BLD25_00920 [Candidatus Gracilibacteria bacterium GN02-872]RKW21313.1 MAG: type II secretion system F family protein [Candidatus Gracilibacteria bacterium]
MADFLILDNEKKNDNVNNVYNRKKSGFFGQIGELFYSFQKIRTKEKIQLYRLLSTMLNAGLTLVKAVGVLEKQQKKGTYKKILMRFSENLTSGKRLSDCLADFPNDFSEAEVGMVKSGEKTGQLTDVLMELAIQTERLDSINGKIKSAMIYPTFIVLVVVSVVYVIMTMVVPKLVEVFGDKETLPNSTKNLISVSEFLSNNGVFILIFLIVLYVFFFFWRRTPTGAYIFDEYVFKIPIFGPMMKKIILSKFSRIFSGLISSGVSVLESLRITAEAVGNEVYKQRILLINEDVSKGIKIWESLDGDKLFPDMMVQMIQVGEETAKLEETVLKVSDYYDEEVDNTIANINKLLEPIIIISLAIVVGFIAMAILEPIMNLADTVSNK